MDPQEAFLGGLWAGGKLDGSLITVEGCSKQEIPCSCWLFEWHLCLTLANGAVRSVPIPDVERVRVTERMSFRKRTFAATPLKRVVVSLEAESCETCIALNSEEGQQFGKAVNFLWRLHRGKVTQREAVFVSCCRLFDVLTMLTLLPMQLACTMSTTAAALPVEGTLALHVAADCVAVTFGPDDDTQPRVLQVNLDEILMLRCIKKLMTRMELRMLRRREEQAGSEVLYVFSDFKTTLTAAAEALLQRVWCVNCSSLVTLTLHKSELEAAASPFSAWVPQTVEAIEKIPDSECHTLEEVQRLLDTFQSIDNDGNGYITATEFTASLGPAFRPEVCEAVFRVFDCDGDKHVAFPEYLFGCRVLTLGSDEDRLRYQHRIFDADNSGYVTEDNFVSVMRLLRSVADKSAPPESDLKLFATLGRGSRLSASEFRDAMLSNPGFCAVVEAALRGKQEADTADTQTRGGKQVVFGDGQWLRVTCILLGIQHSVRHRLSTRAERGFLPADAFVEEKTWNLTEGKEVQHPPKLESTSKAEPSTPANSTVYFTDHCPQVFDDLQRSAGLEAAQYLDSLGITQLQLAMLSGAMTSLHEMASSSRSGSFFFLSHDTRFIIKTLPQDEAATFRRILRPYYAHFMNNPNTLLTRFHGLHTIQYGDQRLTFVVMQNVFNPRLPVHVSYDLKGSTVNRFTPKDKRVKGVALKDLDLEGKSMLLDAGPHAALMRQLEVDSALLRSCNLIDYSLLLGVHRSPVPVPDEPPSPEMGGVPLDPLRGFYGGFPSCSRREIYFVGIIDVMTEYSAFKRLEHAAKSIRYLHKGGDGFSCVAPDAYKARFLRFLGSTFVQGSARCGVPSPFSAKQGHEDQPWRASDDGDVALLLGDAERPTPSTAILYTSDSVPLGWGERYSVAKPRALSVLT